MKKLTFYISYSDESELVVEGFGPATVLGAIDDVLSGAYQPSKEGVEVSGFRVEIEDA